MAFPADPRNVRVEMYINGSWVDVTAARDVLETERITIVYGRADANSTAQPSTCNATLNNTGSEYLSRNPLSPYYGQFRMNTPMRTWIPGVVLKLPGGVDAASTPDHASISITGDIDIRFDMTPTTESWLSDNDLITKWGAAGQRSYALILFASGKVSLRWSEDGTNGRAVLSSVPVTTATGSFADAFARLAVRATLDVNDGAGGHLVTFYTAPTMAGPWTQLGISGVASGGGTTSIFDSTTAVRVGAAAASSSDTWGSSAASDVHKAEIRSGIGGTLAAAPNFNAQTAGSTGFTDATGRAWTLVGSATIGTGARPVYPRHYGEIAQTLPRWDAGGRWATVPVQAAGLLRRITQGKQTSNTSLKDYLLAQSLLDYWPLDDGPAASQGANADGTNNPFKRNGTAAGTFGGDLGPYNGTGLIITDTGTGSFFGLIGTGSSDTTCTLDFLYRPDIAGSMAATLQLNGGVAWVLTLRHDVTNNDFVLQRFDDGIPTSLGDTAPMSQLYDYHVHHVRMQLTENGANIDWTVYLDGASILSGTQTSASLPGMAWVQFNYTPQLENAIITLGDVAIWNNTHPAPDLATVIIAANGWTGQTCGRRFERLTADNNYEFLHVGDLDDTLAMGAQYSDYYSNQLLEIEATDLALIYEPRDRLAVGLRTRASLYSQAPAAILRFDLAQMQQPFEPVDDDQQLRNDVFAQQREGSSYRATQTTGPLSVTAVGRYKDEVAVNVATDAILPPVAGWLLTLGTIDDYRYPQVTVWLHSDGVAADPALVDAILTLNLGDRIRITNTDLLNIYDDIDLLVHGWTETIGVHEHYITFNCAPAAPYDVFTILGAGYANWIDPGEGSTLNSGITSTATSISIASTGFLWSTTGGDYPVNVMIGGEEMTLTAVSGASSPQTGTVTRSINGVVKTHSSGELIRLKRPGIAGL